MNRIVVLDIGNIQFRAIFSYLGQYKRELEEIMASNIDIEQAKQVLEEKIKRREIYISNPVYTFCNMISGYHNQLKIDLEDMIIAAQDYGSWRKDVDKNYKAQRQEYRESVKPKEWWEGQYTEFNNLYQQLNLALPYHWIKIFKIEADDIGSVCCRVFKDKEIILITSDKDWEMLLSFPNVKIYSPISKKFKKIPNPTKILLDKIHGDISDNLLDSPSSEAEFERRKKIVDLINPLPNFVEQPIKEGLNKIMPKNIYLHKIPFPSIREKFKKIYNLEE